jgi:hypothetical protein
MCMYLFAHTYKISQLLCCLYVLKDTYKYKHASSLMASAIPTLENAATLLQTVMQAHCTHWRLALSDDTAGSPLDLPDGHYGLSWNAWLAKPPPPWAP